MVRHLYWFTHDDDDDDDGQDCFTYVHHTHTSAGMFEWLLIYETGCGECHFLIPGFFL